MGERMGTSWNASESTRFVYGQRVPHDSIESDRPADLSSAVSNPYPYIRGDVRASRASASADSSHLEGQLLSVYSWSVKRVASVVVFCACSTMKLLLYMHFCTAVSKLLCTWYTQTLLFDLQLEHVRLAFFFVSRIGAAEQSTTLEVLQVSMS